MFAAIGSEDLDDILSAKFLYQTKMPCLHGLLLLLLLINRIRAIIIGGSICSSADLDGGLTH